MKRVSLPTSPWNCITHVAAAALFMHFLFATCSFVPLSLFFSPLLHLFLSRGTFDAAPPRLRIIERYGKLDGVSGKNGRAPMRKAFLMLIFRGFYVGNGRAYTLVTIIGLRFPFEILSGRSKAKYSRVEGTLWKFTEQPMVLFYLRSTCYLVLLVEIM